MSKTIEINREITIKMLIILLCKDDEYLHENEQFDDLWEGKLLFFLIKGRPKVWKSFPEYQNHQPIRKGNLKKFTIFSIKSSNLTSNHQPEWQTKTISKE